MIKSDTTKLVHIPVLDSNTGVIKKVVFPNDIQIGTTQNKAELQLLGRLSLSGDVYNVYSQNPQIYISNTDSIILVNNVNLTATIDITVYLPINARNYQIIFIKDYSSTAASNNIIVTPLNGTTIDGSSSRTLSSDDDSLTVFYYNNSWYTLIGSSGGGGGGGAPVDASYVVIGSNTTLTHERVLTQGTGISISDGGANNNVTLSLATLSPNPAGTYTNATVTVDSRGRVTSASTGTGSGAPTDAQYITLALNGSLTNERVLTQGTGIIITDGGANSTATLSLATISPNPAGSYTNANVTIDAYGRVTTVSNGSSGGAPTSATYVTLSLDGTLSNERVLTAGTGIRVTDGGANSNVTLAINDSVVATISGSIFTGKVVASNLSGSLTQLSDGSSYLIAGSNVTITSQSNGSVIIASTGGSGGAPTNAQYVTLALDGTLTDERVLVASTGLRLVDGGANNNATLSVNDNIVATISGSTFTGKVVASNLSGSLTQLANGSSYLVAGSYITITSQSNGSIVIASAATITGSAGSGTTLYSFPISQGIESTNVASDTSKLMIGSMYYNYTKISQMTGTKSYYFRGIVSSTETPISASLDLYDASSTVYGEPGIISGSIISSSITFPNLLEADITSQISTITNNCILEARLWKNPVGTMTSSVSCYNASLDVEIS